MVKEKEEAIQRQSTLEKKIHELEKQGTIKIQKKGDGDIAILPVVASGTLSAGSEAGVGSFVGPVMGATSSGPLPPPPPPLPPSSDTPEAGEETCLRTPGQYLGRCLSLLTSCGFDCSLLSDFKNYLYFEIKVISLQFANVAVFFPIAYRKLYMFLKATRYPCRCFVFGYFIST